MANVASYLSPDNTETPKLSDRGFEAIPSITLLWLTDLADGLLFIPTIILIATHYRPLYLLCKVLLTWSFCNIMRITTVAITSMPDPRDGCILMGTTGFQPGSGGWGYFVWRSYGVCASDVLVAFYVAGGNFYIWTYILDHYVEEKGRLKDLTHPWGEGLPDSRPHVQKREERKRQAVLDAEKEANARTEAQAQMWSIATEIPPIRLTDPMSSSVYERSFRSVGDAPPTSALAATGTGTGTGVEEISEARARQPSDGRQLQSHQHQEEQDVQTIISHLQVTPEEDVDDEYKHGPFQLPETPAQKE
ncbi:hypothetical protein KI688_002630 [Linnemannia hyalina]|uniref:Uncharacterized protein n=1 Tax=Linnemannia hyalina TaxID=64524 RepID=A0A9P8BRT2_9FUNG|nr:hypothetical protein KI688_002630 [Linnemannia hyalina]